MTSSAPIHLTISTFLVVQTPVTRDPNDLAICTAKRARAVDRPSCRAGLALGRERHRAL
jgi:hypothetical protein